MYKKDIDAANVAGNRLRRTIKEKIKSVIIDDFLREELDNLQKSIDRIDYNLFLKTITPIYIKLKINMPNVLYKILDDDETFKKIGWSFILGLKGVNKPQAKNSIIIDGEECLDIVSASEMLNVHKSTIVRWLETGKLKKANSDNMKKVYIKKSDINEFLKSKN